MGKGKEESRVRSEGASPRVVTAARCAARAVDRVAALSARRFRQGQKATAVTTAALVCCIRLAVGDNVFPPQSRPRRPHTNVGRRRRERPAGQRDERVARRRADRRRQRMCRRRRRAANNGCAHGSEKGERVTNHLADLGEASAPRDFRANPRWPGRRPAAGRRAPRGFWDGWESDLWDGWSGAPRARAVQRTAKKSRVQTLGREIGVDGHQDYNASGSNRGVKRCWAVAAPACCSRSSPLCFFR